MPHCPASYVLMVMMHGDDMLPLRLLVNYTLKLLHVGASFDVLRFAQLISLHTCELVDKIIEGDTSFQSSQVA